MNSCKKCLIILFSLLTALYSSAQQAEISSSTKLNSKISKFRILGKTGNKIIVERYGNNIHFLDAYNSKLRITSSKQIPLEKNEYIKKIWLQPKKSWIIKLQHNKNNTAIQAIKIDENLRLSDKVQTLDSIVERKDLIENNLRVQLSLNESKLLMYAPIFNQNKVDYFYTRVYDDNLNVLTQNKITAPELISNTFVKAFLFNNGAYLFITTNDIQEEKEFYFTYINELGEISTYDFNPIKNIYKKLEFEIDETNMAIIASGFFSKENENKKDKNGAEEFFITKINLNTFENIYTEIIPFTNELYRDITGKQSATDPPQLFTFYINTIIPKNDGGAIVFAESYFKNEEEYLNNTYFSISGLNNYSTTTIYNYNDIIAYHIDENGEFTEYQLIRKKQVSQNDNGSYSSFYIANLQNELRLIYLEEILLDAQLRQATITEEKKAKANNILNIGSKNILPVINMSKQTSPNELIIPSFLKNKLQLLKLTF